MKSNYFPKTEIIVVLDNIRSALNVGAIVRTLDGAGIKNILLVGITPSLDNSKILKTSIGAEKNITAKYFTNIEPELKKYKNEGYLIYAIEQSKNSVCFNKIDFKISEKIILIFGNEITGVDNTLLEFCDKIIEIPMLGIKQSLNVATTVGIITYYIRSFEI